MLEIVPMTLKEANTFVEQNHRHHEPVVGHKFSIGLSGGEKIVGVAIAGRPVAWHLDDGWTLEVNRLCTDGIQNACSMLYAAAWRAARAMGYKRIVTYILESEDGASLRASGWKCVGQAGGLHWTGRRRPEVDLYPAQMKVQILGRGPHRFMSHKGRQHRKHRGQILAVFTHFCSVWTANVCPYGIIRTNRKTLVLQRVDWFVLILFPLKTASERGLREGVITRGYT